MLKYSKNYLKKYNFKNIQTQISNVKKLFSKAFTQKSKINKTLSLILIGRFQEEYIFYHHVERWAKALIPNGQIWKSQLIQPILSFKNLKKSEELLDDPRIICQTHRS